MVLIAALVIGRVERARIASGLRGQTGARFCERADELIELVAAGGVAALLTELYDVSGASTVPAIRALKQRYPTLPVLAYISTCAADIHALVRAIAAGVDDVVVRGMDNLDTVLPAAIGQARQLSAATEISRAVEPIVPTEVRPFFAYCAGHAWRPLTVRGAAAAISLPPRTLDAQLKRAGLLPPRRVIGWHRVLYAAWDLEVPGATIGHVAEHLSFPCPAALSNSLQRYTSLTSSALRRKGGFRYLLELFCTVLRAA